MGPLCLSYTSRTFSGCAAPRRAGAALPPASALGCRNLLRKGASSGINALQMFFDKWLTAATMQDPVLAIGGAAGDHPMDHHPDAACPLRTRGKMSFAL